MNTTFYKTSPLKSLAATTLACTALLTACNTTPSTSAAPSAWTIAQDQSNITFVTTKAGQAGVGGIAETQTFKRFSGGIDAQGKVTLAIDLASVDTGVEIRDERLRTMLWNVKATPQAVFAAQLPAEALNRINSSTGVTMDVEGQLQMAGQTKPVKAKLRVNRLNNDQLQVVTLAPILVNANDYGIRNGVEAMREVMGLNFLASSAPVSFTIQLSKQKP
jgi:polyisoprenoid-binding protein YceI